MTSSGRRSARPGVARHPCSCFRSRVIRSGSATLARRFRAPCAWEPGRACSRHREPGPFARCGCFATDWRCPLCRRRARHRSARHRSRCPRGARHRHDEARRPGHPARADGAGQRELAVLAVGPSPAAHAATCTCWCPRRSGRQSSRGRRRWERNTAVARWWRWLLRRTTTSRRAGPGTEASEEGLRGPPRSTRRSASRARYGSGRRVHQSSTASQLV
jgi:hypothetical protein